MNETIQVRIVSTVPKSQTRSRRSWITPHLETLISRPGEHLEVTAPLRRIGTLTNTIRRQATRLGHTVTIEVRPGPTSETRSIYATLRN